MGKLRTKATTYVYQDGEFLQKCESMNAASRLTGESIGNVNNILTMPRWSKKGYFYSNKKLRPDQLPEYDEEKVHKKKGYRFDEDDFQFQVSSKKSKAKTELTKFIYARLSQHWKEIPAVVARMERKYLQQLLDTL